MTFELEVGGSTRRVEVRGEEVLVDDRIFRVDVAKAGQVWSLVLGSVNVALRGHGTVAGEAAPTQSYEVSIVERTADDLIAHVNGHDVPVKVASRDARHHAGSAQTEGGRSHGCHQRWLVSCGGSDAWTDREGAREGRRQSGGPPGSRRS